MTRHTRIPLIAHLARLGRLPRNARSVRALGPLVLTLIVVVIAAILLIGQLRPRAQALGQASAAPMRIARADLHVETPLNGEDLEMNVSITQTGNDCQAALNGDVCLRYSVVLDEKPLMAGYGIIPIANVHVTPSNIVLNVDTSKVPNFTNIVGPGGRIIINWKALTAVTKAGVLHAATAQGGIANYNIPSSGVISSLLFR